MSFVFWGQLVLLSIAGLVVLALSVYALISAIRFPAEAYTASDRRSKTFWVVVTAVCTLVALGCLPVIGTLSTISIFNMVAAAAAGIFLADVLPALKWITGRGGNSRGMYRGY